MNKLFKLYLILYRITIVVENVMYIIIYRVKYYKVILYISLYMRSQ